VSTIKVDTIQTRAGASEISINTLKTSTIQTLAGAVPTASDVGINVAGTVIQTKHSSGDGIFISNSSFANKLDLYIESSTIGYSNTSIEIDIYLEDILGNSRKVIYFHTTEDKALSVNYLSASVLKPGARSTTERGRSMSSSTLAVSSRETTVTSKGSLPKLYRPPEDIR